MKHSSPSASSIRNVFRRCLALFVTLICFLPAIGLAGSVFLMVNNVDPSVAKIKFLHSTNNPATAGTNGVRWTTNTVVVQSGSLQTVTNLIQNVPPGTNWVSCFYINTDGLMGGLATNTLKIVIPPDANDPVVVPFSMLIDDGDSMLISRDINGPYRERFSARIVRATITAASVSTPPTDQIAVTWTHYADDPQQFAISQAALLAMKASARTKPPLP